MKTELNAHFDIDVVIEDLDDGQHGEDWGKSSVSMTIGDYQVSLTPDNGQFLLSTPFGPPNRYQSWVVGFEAFLQETRHITQSAVDQAVASEIRGAKAELDEARRARQKVLAKAHPKALTAEELAAADLAREQAAEAELQRLRDEAREKAEADLS